MSKLLYKCMTKATTAEGDQIRHSLSWAVSRRGSLKVYSDRLECGDWVIPNSEIQKAVLTSVRSTLFLPGYILRVETKEKSYQFGLNGGRFWKSELPFLVVRESGSLGFSGFSVAIRIILVATLIYLLWRKFA